MGKEQRSTSQYRIKSFNKFFFIIPLSDFIDYKLLKETSKDGKIIFIGNVLN